MITVIQKFSSGRCLSLGIVLWLVFLLMGMFAAQPLRAILMGIAAISAAAVLLGTVSFLKGEFALVRKNRREVTNRIDALVAECQSQMGIASIGYIGRESRELEPAQRAAASGGMNSKGGTIFSPGSITASVVLEKPDTHMAGRQAATQLMSADSDLKLRTLLNARPSERRRRVYWIGPFESSGELDGRWDIRHAGPTTVYGEPDTTLAYVVVNLASLDYSGWDYLTSSRSFLQFDALRSFLTKARKNGTVIVLVNEMTPNHFTASLESIADIVVNPDGSTNQDEAYLSLPIVGIIRHAIKDMD